MRWFSFIGFYRFLTWHSAWLGERILVRRLRVGKEDTKRLDERRGLHKTPRPQGKLIWFHTASVGEALMALTLGQAFLKKHKDAYVLITSGTQTAADIISKRLPKRCYHAYSPLDVKKWVQNFLDHWRPDVAIWIESEFWPNLVLETYSRAIPMCVVNGRMSKKSYDKWLFARSSIAHMLASFDHAFVQNAKTHYYFIDLGMDVLKITQIPSLKNNALPLPYDCEDFEHLQKNIKNRPLWLAASTHAGEEEEMVIAHNVFSKKFKNALLILVPRHPERGKALADKFTDKGWRVGYRSCGDEILPDMQIYIADTIGEMGLWFRLSKLSFIGASMIDNIGGHNPYEPAQLGSAILHGAFVTNFADIYERLDQEGGAMLVTSGFELGQCLKDMFGKKGQEQAAKATEIIGQEQNATSEVLDYIADLLTHKNLKRENETA